MIFLSLSYDFKILLRHELNQKKKLILNNYFKKYVFYQIEEKYVNTLRCDENKKG